MYFSAREIRKDNPAGDFFSKALKAPYEQICENADLIGKAGDLRAPIDWDKGLNVATGKEVDSLIADGVVDPMKVVRLALENAASVAGLLVMSSSSVAFASHEVKDDGR